MNLYRLLQRRAADGRPVRVGLIGAGKFGTMFLAQARDLPGLQVMAVADLDATRAHAALASAGWPPERCAAGSLEAARRGGGCHVGEDSLGLIAADGLDVVIEATGAPEVGLIHARAACTAGKHIVMVNVEADVLAGPLLAREAAAAGLVYSLAYGDQPALICELVDWARACGFPVMAAGKGTKYLPAFHESTPETVWQHYGLNPEAAAAGGMNPKMFNSFLDGTKSAIEMAAVANATGLAVPGAGLAFPPAEVDQLPEVLRPRDQGGVLEHQGQVEVVSSLARDGRPLDRDLRWGVYVVFEAPGDYSARCFTEYGLVTDSSGRVSALYRPYHLIGMELTVSVLSAALRGEPTGVPEDFRADVAAVAKRDLAAGELLDGEGGATVWGRLMPAEASLAQGALPIGLAHGARLRRPVAKGAVLTSSDLESLVEGPALTVRREMEAAFAPGRAAAQ